MPKRADALHGTQRGAEHETLAKCAPPLASPDTRERAASQRALPRMDRAAHRAGAVARTRRHAPRHRHPHRRTCRIRFIIKGLGGHAGALLMPDRRDALCAAAELISSIEHHALATGAIDTVATVGTCDVYPGAVNSVPSRVHPATRHSRYRSGPPRERDGVRAPRYRGHPKRGATFASLKSS